MNETIDNKKLRTLKMRIITTVRDNQKTKQFKDNEMIEKLRKLIEREVDNDN